MFNKELNSQDGERLKAKEALARSLLWIETGVTGGGFVLKGLRREESNSVRIFDNDLLERAYKTYPMLQFALWYSAATFFFYRAFSNDQLSALEIFAVAIPVILGWTLFEYSVHRWLFHFSSDSKKALRIRYILHDHHHENPHDLTRVLFPFLPVLLFSVISYGLEYLLVGPTLMDPFFGWVCLVYISYELAHYSLHKYNFDNAIFRKFKRFHMIHHFTKESTNFGVTHMFWDRIFKTTYQRAAGAEASANPQIEHQEVLLVANSPTPVKFNTTMPSVIE